MSETIGDITYLGTIGANVLQIKQPSVQQKDTYDLDRASVTYDGAPSRMETFIAAFARGDEMEFVDGSGSNRTISTMFLTGSSAGDHPYQVEAALNYIGAMDDLPPPKIDDSLVTSSITTTATITDSGDPLYTEDGVGNPTTKISGTVEYKSARTNISWFTLDEPDPNVPEFDTVSNTTPPLDRPFKLTINAGNQPGQLPGFADLGDMILLFNTLLAETHVEDYRIEEVVVGKLWRCSVCVQYVLVATP